MDKEIVERVRKAIFGVLNCWDVNVDAQREIISTAILPEIKQARAEVLAEVSKHRLDMDEGLCACGWESKGETWADHILSLQPTASDLEALLREERERCLREIYDGNDCTDATGLWRSQRETIYGLQKELEKARAGEGKG